MNWQVFHTCDKHYFFLLLLLMKIFDFYILLIIVKEVKAYTGNNST